MRISITKAEARRLAEYFARKDHGLNPVLEDDADLVEWVQFTVSQAVGCESQEVDVSVTKNEVILSAGADIIAAIRLNWLA